MPRSPLSSALCTALFALAAVAARAQTAAAPAAAPDDTASSPVFTPQAAAAPVIKAPPADQEDNHGDTRRIQSSELSGALMSSMPKYSPPKPEAPKPEAAPTDQPKNGVVRLPKYVVRDAPPPIFTKKGIMTDAERKEAAMKQYIIDTKDMPTLAAFMSQTLFQANASQQYADAERASDISGLRSDAAAARISGDGAESDFIRQQSNDTYLRRSDWAPIGSGTKTSSSMGDSGGGNGQ